MEILGVIVIASIIVYVVKFASGFGISIPTLGVYCGLENLGQATSKAEWVIDTETNVSFRGEQ